MAKITTVYDIKVSPRPYKVPFGIALLGCFRSPDMLAPLERHQDRIVDGGRLTYAKMPPVAGKRMPNMS